jgi:hypothetical protein
VAGIVYSPRGAIEATVDVQGAGVQAWDCREDGAFVHQQGAAVNLDDKRYRIESMLRALLAGGLAGRGTEAVMEGARDLIRCAEAMVDLVDQWKPT